MIPRHEIPPICMASVAVGSCRQSLNARKYAPGFMILSHSLIHMLHQRIHARLSFASPAKSGRPWYLFSYFLLVACCRWLILRPPLQYGGSVIIASTVQSGISRSTAMASP
nr:MAG TPA: hypothetical protein [Caudoviricetes sp.]